MTSQRKDYQVAKLPFSVSSVSFEALNKRERDKLCKVILRAKITAKKSVSLALNQIIVIV